MESLYGPDAVEREINRLSGQTMFGIANLINPATIKPIWCAGPRCCTGWALVPNEGRADAFMRAMNAGWTHTGIGTEYREWCPEHRPEELDHDAADCPHRVDVTAATDAHQVFLHGDCTSDRWRGSAVSQPRTFSEALAQQHPQRMMCLPCIAERKAAEQAGQPVESLPGVREAVTMLGGAPHCYEHITVQRNTGLVVPQ